jgi:hypothetical protein
VSPPSKASVSHETSDNWKLKIRSTCKKPALHAKNLTEYSQFMSLMQFFCSSWHDRQFPQKAPSNKSSDSYNKRRQSRLGAASALQIGFTPSLQHQRPGVEAGTSSTWRIRATI